MAYYDTPRTPAAGSLSRLVSGLFGQFIAWREARLTRAALAGLTDRELYDIGLQRSDLDNMSRQDLARF